MARELSLEIYSITLTICQQKKRNKGQRQEACLKCSSETGLQAPFPSRGPHISGGSVILNDRVTPCGRAPSSSKETVKHVLISSVKAGLLWWLPPFCPLYLTSFVLRALCPTYLIQIKGVGGS